MGDDLMTTEKFSMATLLRNTVRRHGLSCLAMVAVIEVMHYFRHGGLDLTDVRDGVIALCVFGLVPLLSEYNRMVNGTQDAPKG